MRADETTEFGSRVFMAKAFMYTTSKCPSPQRCTVIEQHVDLVLIACVHLRKYRAVMGQKNNNNNKNHLTDWLSVPAEGRHQKFTPFQTLKSQREPSVRQMHNCRYNSLENPLAKYAHLILFFFFVFVITAQLTH